MYDEFAEALDRMAFLWGEAFAETCSKKDAFTEDSELYKYAEDCKDEAFDLMKKYFYQLWD